MDFFESQERAKRNTAWLVLLFALAVAGTVAGVHLVLTLVVAGKGGGDISFDPSVLLASAGGVLLVVLVGTGVKFAQMSHGGTAVAAALGGRQIDPGSGDPAERRVLNVVEEMAIASGLRVPPVYVMEDRSINAFAAGNSEKDAVIGVTRGCIERLSRDELQGVVAHEFSHVFHRDMRLNMRLVAWLGGIFAVSLVGRMLLRAAATSRSSRGKNDGRAVMLGLGVALFLVGIIGYFFGRLIQCAVSRQREYLADASAVQYTRNPEGIAGALEKIAAGAGSRLAAPAAAEFSHFLFSEGVASLFATHPPVGTRIARIRGTRVLPAAPARETASPDATGPSVREADGSPPPVTYAAAAGASRQAPPSVPAAAVRAARAAVGSLTPAEVGVAKAAIAGLPPAYADAARNPYSARAVVCALLLSPEAPMRGRQLAAITAGDRSLAGATAVLHGSAPVRPAQRLPLLEMAASSLAMLSPAQQAGFRTVLAQLMAVDGEIDRLEWTVRVLLRRATEPGTAVPAPHAPSDRDIALVVSVLSWSGATDAMAADRAWRAAAGVHPAIGTGPFPAAQCTLDALDGSLRALASARPAMRRAMVDACVAAVTADGRTTVDEAELLRAACAAVGAPMPPIAAAA
jgi:Zn-dependent protease with chaperone function